MDQLPAFGTGIASVIGPTFSIYVPLVAANAKAIKSTPRETFSYGSHARQELDVYHPAKDTTTNGPILMFFYGGGLVQGGKQTPLLPDGLIHANVGHFFAHNGFTTVIADYRLMSHGARFPSGGEDVSLSVSWVAENLAADRQRDIFLMGNSAGGIHLSTFLYSPEFAEQTAAILPSSGVKTTGGLSLRAAILLSVPFDFSGAAHEREEVLHDYFGDDIADRSPLGLLQAAQQFGRAPLAGVKTMVWNATLDPEDEILMPREKFLAAWDKKAAVDAPMVEGPNHISPPLGLGTGIEREEAWGRQVVNWMWMASR